MNLVISSSGFNGLENRYLSINLLVKYYVWNIENTSQIVNSKQLDYIIRYVLRNQLHYREPDLLTKYMDNMYNMDNIDII